MAMIFGVIYERSKLMLSSVNLPNLKINQYADIYRTEVLPVLSTIKLKLIQETIQIIRPTNWSESKLRNIIKAQKQLILSQY